MTMSSKTTDPLIQDSTLYILQYEIKTTTTAIIYDVYDGYIEVLTENKERYLIPNTEKEAKSFFKSIIGKGKS